MKTFREQASAEGCYIEVLMINGEMQHSLSQKPFYLENICKGGFRFIAEENFELEDRIQVLLRFPNDHAQQVLGRICYCDEIDNTRTAYGFSVIDGFYSLHDSAA
ncbi:MAG: PilZ domain-containing protein [Gammaproteobacteria bacterium]|nr:PilZ domain-containing protein [Gammaproteobacteria bacterium]